MIRLGSAAAGRSLRSQSANLLIGGSRTPRSQIPPSKYATHASPTLDHEVPTGSYEWVATTVHSAEPSFQWNQSRSEQEFAEILTEIKMRLRRVEVPRNARHMVFRPKNSQLLETLNITDKDGKPYTPQTWKGPPNRKQLMKLLRRVTTPETAALAAQILKSYIQHYPSEVQTIHIGTFLRTAARAGSYYSALDLVQSDKFRHLINEEVAREAIRIGAIRAVALDVSSSGNDLIRLYHRMHLHVPTLHGDLSTHLLMVYGLAPHSTTTASTLSMHVSTMAGLLHNEQVLSPDTDMKKQHGLQFHYMDLVLGRTGLYTLPSELSAHVDIPKLNALIAAIETLFAANRMSSPLERYVKHAAYGIQAESDASGSDTRALCQ